MIRKILKLSVLTIGIYLISVSYYGARTATEKGKPIGEAAQAAIQEVLLAIRPATNGGKALVASFIKPKDQDAPRVEEADTTDTDPPSTATEKTPTEKKKSSLPAPPKNTKEAPIVMVKAEKTSEETPSCPAGVSGSAAPKLVLDCNDKQTSGETATVGIQFSDPEGDIHAWEQRFIIEIPAIDLTKPGEWIELNFEKSSTCGSGRSPAIITLPTIEGVQATYTLEARLIDKAGNKSETTSCILQEA